MLTAQIREKITGRDVLALMCSSKKGQAGLRLLHVLRKIESFADKPPAAA
jgi:hypothetical protein